MNKKTIIVLVVILMTAVIAGGFWYTKNQNNVILNSFQDLDEQSQEIQKEKDGTPREIEIQGGQNDENIEELSFDKVDTSDWETYRNEEYGFEFKYPNNLELVFQNEFDSHGTATVIFYNSSYYEDISNSVNPILSIIDKNISYLLLDIIGYDYVKASDFNIKEYIVPSLFSYDKEIDISQKILEWNNVVSEDGETNINLYVTETADEQIKTRGAIWISNGKLFNIKMIGEGDTYKNIAITFQ